MHTYAHMHTHTQPAAKQTLSEQGGKWKWRAGHMQGQETLSSVDSFSRQMLWAPRVSGTAREAKRSKPSSCLMATEEETMTVTDN